MQAAAHSLTLLPRQTRLINATEGMQLEVQSGCLWLTRPGDAVDRFLVAGSRIALHENGVLLQSDHQPGTRGLEAARYRLTPLQPVGQSLRGLDQGRAPATRAAPTPWFVRACKALFVMCKRQPLLQ
jgi:hypothetical protein